MNLDDAISAHAEWKTKLRAAINAQEQMDVASISADNCCPLGKWLHGEAKTKYGTLASYQRTLENHASFHKEAGKVAQAINAKRYDEAEGMLGGGTAYTQASGAVGGAIIALKREIKH